MFSKGDKILLMSGSILNKESYCRNLGIEVNDCSFLSLDSPFPVENRKIYIIGSGSMSKKNIDATMPVLIKDIKKILKIHK
jgi:Rad3-related DNA helicase